MSSRADPLEFGLTARRVSEKADEHSCALIIDRKSRIIMAEGKSILEKCRKILAARPGVRVVLETTAPLCSRPKIICLLME